MKLKTNNSTAFIAITNCTTNFAWLIVWRTIDWSHFLLSGSNKSAYKHDKYELTEMPNGLSYNSMFLQNVFLIESYRIWNAIQFIDCLWAHLLAQFIFIFIFVHLFEILAMHTQNLLWKCEKETQNVKINVPFLFALCCSRFYLTPRFYFAFQINSINLLTVSIFFVWLMLF